MFVMMSMTTRDSSWISSIVMNFRPFNSNLKSGNRRPLEIKFAPTFVLVLEILAHRKCVLFLAVIQQRTEKIFFGSPPQVKSSVKARGHVTYGELVLSRRFSSSITHFTHFRLSD